jgi:hypothetical protein
MTDANRNHNQPDRAQERSPESPHASPQSDGELDSGGFGSPTRSRSADRASADDRGPGLERGWRSFSGDREHDELGSEMDDDRLVEDGDDMGMDDGLGGPGRSER